MATVKEPEERDEPDRIENPSQSTNEIGALSTTVPPSSPISSEEPLPVEPPLVWKTIASGASEETPSTSYDADRVLGELRSFYLYGRLGTQSIEHVSQRWPTPALLTRYKDLSRIRYDYPLCLNKEEPARSLTAIVDEVITAVTDQSDEGQGLKRHVYQLEARVKSLAEKEPGARLSTLWNRAADELVATTLLADDEKERLKQNMNVARGALRVDGHVVNCDTEAARRLFEAAVDLHWKTRCEKWCGDLDAIILGLRQILSADFAHTPEAASPEHLQASVGSGSKEDLNFQALSSILKDSDLGKPIPVNRRKRIEGAVATLDHVRPIFDGKAVGTRRDTSTTIGAEIIENDCSGAVHRFVEQMQMMVDFFKAIQIARLEINNKYHEPVHDPFFATYGVTHLSPEEFELCPPVLLSLTTEFFAGPDKGKLLDILNAGIPIKVLVQLDDLFDDGGSTDGPAVTLGAQARLANMAAALNHVYVFQAPLSHASILQPGFVKGLGFDGPALFSVYTGNREHQPSLSAYHSAAAATESRVFPSFTFDPSKGDALAERVSIGDNPQPEKDWPTDSFSYATAQDGETEIEMGFTPADFLFCDIRLASHFWRVPPSKWHEEMMPLHEFLKLDEETALTKVPYLTTVDPDGRLVRVVMTRVILTLVGRCASQWKHVQEFGGINNSFARKALDEEKQRLEDDSRREIEEVKRQYDAQLDRNLGDLTAVIVRRIVSQIVTGGGLGTGEPVVTGAQAAAPAAGAEPPAAGVSAPAPAEAVDEEEDEAISFDNPYIDTPLCTTCDECTGINKNMFGYNENKQAFVKDPDAGTYEELVRAAEKCPVHIIHPGKPKNPNEPGLDKLLERAARFN